MTITTLMALFAMGLFTVGSWIVLAMQIHHLDRRIYWMERREGYSGKEKR